MLRQKNRSLVQQDTSDFLAIERRFLHINDNFGFVALRPKSTAMVIAGRSVHLTTLFPGQA